MSIEEALQYRYSLSQKKRGLPSKSTMGGANGRNQSTFSQISTEAQ